MYEGSYIEHSCSYCYVSVWEKGWGGGGGGGGGGIQMGVDRREEITRWRKQSHFSLAECRICMLVGCLMSQQHASVSQGWICSDNLCAATLR